MAKLQGVFFTQKNNVQQFLTKGSFGNAFLDRSNVAFVNAKLPCSTFSMDKCDMWQVYDYLEANAADFGVSKYGDYAYKVKLQAAPAVA